MNKLLLALRLVIVGCSLCVAPVVVSGNTGLRGEAAENRLETRCGWLVNPTPGNIWFYDRDAEWTIGVQGGYQVEAEWDWPVFKPGQWVRTNINYGYGCACLRLRVDKQKEQVLEIKSSSARPLAACRKDQALKKWKDMLK